MMNDYDPYEELERAKMELHETRQIVNELIDANNNQAKLVEEMAHGYKFLAEQVWENQQMVSEIGVTLNSIVTSLNKGRE